MKTIAHNNNTEQDWIDVLAEAIGGSIEGNFIKGDNEIWKGTHFVLPIEDGITAMLVDTTYKEEVLLKYHNENSNFIGLYFYLTNLDVEFIIEKQSTLIGKLNFNLSVVDCAIDMHYIVRNGTRIFVICILFDKEALKKYFAKITKIAPIANIILDAEKNTIIRLDRMCLDSLILIKDFRKTPYDNPLYETYFKGLIYGLIGNYLNQLGNKKIIIDKTINVDIKSIITSKAMLQSNIEGPFPGVIFLAEQVSMSPSKYKKLFAKISGVNPGTYFYNNKLYRAKELLETGKFTVNEVAHKLNYANVSYLAKRFNEMYGVFPKEYQSLF
ncbi:helix-turn-helix transcriptional regulator [Flavobacterium sp. F-65]|jgi:AraC-like DNA-binding protein|uniref:Helix-turn-helix transcriptional regulator n=1 Tax=Flavobacterium pisciphilum TaxID=2893755 RepID=A0ABS8MQ83_9FLAO|nr:helix-turn-helix transcriptional regulator [Flavobacterium sp. F-65]MCC9070292.1 helix-turn-helix transcriptional regulator [Flavobacterium sp. F-65]